MDLHRAATLQESFARADERPEALDDAAALLDELGWMHLLLPPAHEGLPPDGTSRRPFGQLDAEGGFWPRVFTDSDALHAFAKDRDDVRGAEVYESRAERWLGGLMRILRAGSAGLVLDAGGAVELELSRRAIGGLIAAIAREWFVGETELCVVMQGEKVYYYASRSDQRCAFVFDSKEVAREHLERMRERVPGLRVGTVDRSILLSGLLQAGVSRLFVNPGLADQRAYDRAALDLIQCLREDREPAPEPGLRGSTPDPASQPAAPASTPDPDADPRPEVGTGHRTALRDDPHVDATVRRVRPAPPARPSPPAAPGPGRSDEDSRARLLEIKALIDSGARQTWVVSELLAHDLDLWVPVAPGNADGSFWPLAEPRRDASGREVLSTSLYSNEPMARMALRDAGRADSRLVHVGGIEAFRWVWSSPVEIDEILIDHPAPDGFLSLASRSIPPILFPSILGVRNLDHVPMASWGKLAALPHVHGLKPEVIRAFVDGWHDLSGPPRDGSQPPIEHDGGLYLPVFTHSDRFYEYSRSVGGHAPTPQIAGTVPPFLRWLRLASRCDGVVVDPASPESITLIPSELFYLHLWTEHRRPPEGQQIAAALAVLQSGDYPLDMSAAGRIAADWPLYLAARIAGGGPFDLMTAPGTADLALFTSEAELSDCVRMCRRAGGNLPDVEPLHLLPRLRDNFFRIANERFSGVRIDPGSKRTASGVHLDGKGLDGAIGRLDERLRPRVPGFGRSA